MKWIWTRIPEYEIILSKKLTIIERYNIKSQRRVVNFRKTENTMTVTVKIIYVVFWISLGHISYDELWHINGTIMMMTLMTLMTMCTRKVRSGPTTKRIINTYKMYYLQWDLEVGPSVVFIFGGPRSVCRSTGPIIAYYFWHCDNERALPYKHATINIACVPALLQWTCVLNSCRFRFRFCRGRRKFLIVYNVQSTTDTINRNVITYVIQYYTMRTWA